MDGLWKGSEGGTHRYERGRRVFRSIGKYALGKRGQAVCDAEDVHEDF